MDTMWVPKRDQVPQSGVVGSCRRGKAGRVPNAREVVEGKDRKGEGSGKNHGVRSRAVYLTLKRCRGHVPWAPREAKKGEKSLDGGLPKKKKDSRQSVGSLLSRAP